MSKVRNITQGSLTWFSRILASVSLLALAGAGMLVTIPAAAAHAAVQAHQSYTSELVCGNVVPSAAGTTNQGEPTTMTVGETDGVPCHDNTTGTAATITLLSASPSNACTIVPDSGTSGNYTEETFNAVGTCNFELSYSGDFNSPQYWDLQVTASQSSPPPVCSGALSSSCTPPSGVTYAQGCVPMPSGTVVGMAAASNDQGYWIVDAAGQVDTCGSAANYGELPTAPSSPIVGMALDVAGTGYWLVGSNGAVYNFGSAVSHGSMAGTALNAPMVGMAADPATGGYWLLGADGGVFSFDAPFYGSTGNMKLNKPVVGMAATASGGGYWFVAADGGVFAYGNAPFDGSMGGKPLNRPVVGMAPDFATGGYWLVAADGGIFAFGAPFHGSTGALQLAKPIVGMEANAAGNGYRFVASDGGVFCFGSSQFYGSAA